MFIVHHKLKCAFSLKLEVTLPLTRPKVVKMGPILTRLHIYRKKLFTTIKTQRDSFTNVGCKPIF